MLVEGIPLPGCELQFVLRAFRTAAAAPAEVLAELLDSFAAHGPSSVVGGNLGFRLVREGLVRCGVSADALVETGGLRLPTSGRGVWKLDNFPRRIQ